MDCFEVGDVVMFEIVVSSKKYVVGGSSVLRGAEKIHQKFRTMYVL